MSQMKKNEDGPVKRRLALYGGGGVGVAAVGQQKVEHRWAPIPAANGLANKEVAALVLHHFGTQFEKGRGRLHVAQPHRVDHVDWPLHPAHV